MEHASSQTIAEALKLLDEAAKQSKDELQAALSNKYTHLRSLIREKEGTVMSSLTDAKEYVIDAAAHAKEVGTEKAREIAHEVDRNVAQHSWAYIGGTAVVSLLLGYILGRHGE